MKKTLCLLLVFLFLQSYSQVIVIKHKFYDVHFDCSKKEPLYCHYVLTKKMHNGKYPRTQFHSDKLIGNDKQASQNDYYQDPKNMVFDKGHLCPDDDFTFNKDAESDAMVYTNCAPQDLHFNRGIWHSLENYVRTLSDKSNIEVWTGCIYDGSIKKLNTLIVPTYYWKMIKYNSTYFGWMIPNVSDNEEDFNRYKIDSIKLLKLLN